MIIKTHNKISPKGLELLKDHTISETENHPHGIVLRSYKITPEEFGDNLLAIARAGAGVNNVPVEQCSKQGIVVFNTPGANANAVKELVIAALFMSSRRLGEAINELLKQERKDIAKTTEKIKKNFAGPEIAGKTLGVIGLGAIGALVAEAAESLGMKIVGYDPYARPEVIAKLADKIDKVDELDEMLPKCDYLTIHIPAIESTFNFVKAELIAKMKKGVRILNFSRGELVNSSDLIAGLQSGQVERYITDFADEELIDQKNVVTFPHLGASTPEAEDNCATMACQQLLDFLQRGKITNSVNFPAVQLESSWPATVGVFYKDKPGMIGRISDIFGEQQINIEEVIDKRKDDNAYILFGLNKTPNDDVVEKIKEIDGVIGVRVIN